MYYVRRGIHAISIIPTMLLGWDKWSRVTTNLYVSKVPFSKEEKSLNTFSEEKQGKYQDQAIGLVVSATEEFEISEPILPLLFGNRYDPIRPDAWEEKNIRHILLGIRDFTSSINLQKAIDFIITIQAYRELKKAVLVHCKAGRSRSPMIVASVLGTFDLPQLENAPSYFLQMTDEEFSSKKATLQHKIKKITAKDAYFYASDAKQEKIVCFYLENGKLRPVENNVSALKDRYPLADILTDMKIVEQEFCQLSEEQIKFFITHTTATRVGTCEELVATAIAIISDNRPHINLAEGNIQTAIQIVIEARKYLLLHPNAVKESIEKESRWLVEQTKKNELAALKRAEDDLLKKQIMQLQSYKNLLEYKDKLLKNEPWGKAMVSGPPERVKHIVNLFTSMEESKDDKWYQDLQKLTGPANDLLSASPYWMRGDGQQDQAEREALIHHFKNEVEKLTMLKNTMASEDKSMTVKQAK